MAVDHRGVRLSSTIEAIDVGERRSRRSGGGDDSHSCRRQNQPLPHFSPCQSCYAANNFQGHSGPPHHQLCADLFRKSRRSVAVGGFIHADKVGKIVPQLARPCRHFAGGAAPVVRCTVGGPSKRISGSSNLCAAFLDRLGRHEPAATIAGFALSPLTDRPRKRGRRPLPRRWRSWSAIVVNRPCPPRVELSDARRSDGFESRCRAELSAVERAYQPVRVGVVPRGADPDVAVPARRTDLAGLPPAWIGVGTADLFYDEDVAHAERLNDAGVPCISRSSRARSTASTASARGRECHARTSRAYARHCVPRSRP